MQKKHRPALFGALAFTTVLLSACSSAAPEASGSTEEVSGEAQAALDRAYEGVGSELEDLKPVEVTEGIHLYAISCGEQLPGCSSPSAAVKKAAEAAGWTATIADAKLSTEGLATAIRQAVAGGADVIVPIGNGCGAAQAAFSEAVDAGVTVIGGGGVDDCDPKLWASERLWLPDFTPREQWEQFGRLQADYAFGKTNGDPKIVLLNYTGPAWGPWQADGVKKQVKEIGGEVIETIDVSDAEVADGSVAQKVTTALLSKPEANVLIATYDGMLTGGLSAAIVQAGLDDQLLVIGRNGEAPALDLIRQGNSGIDATVGFAQEWGSWGSVDTAVRVLAGQEPYMIGEPMQLVDAENNLPDSGPYDGPIDYREAFKKAWGMN